ncbi:hypothetical protein SODG_000740 [Sodalis praecaptivus]
MGLTGPFDKGAVVMRRGDDLGFVSAAGFWICIEKWQRPSKIINGFAPSVNCPLASSGSTEAEAIKQEGATSVSQRKTSLSRASVSSNSRGAILARDTEVLIMPSCSSA